MDELVSVCIPAYNNEKDIRATVDSILGQTYSNIELVITDDASTDRTVEIIKSFSDPRIKLFQNEKNLGMSGNWNHCIECAGGKYIKLVCADDILRAGSIEAELKAMQKDPEIVMTINDSIMVNRDMKNLGVFARYGKKGIIDGKVLAKKSLTFNNYFGMPCAVMFRKDIFEKVGGFDSDFKYILDFDLWLLMAPLGKVAVLDEKLNYFMLRKDSNTGKVMSKEKKPYYLEHVHLLEKHASNLQVGKFGVFVSKVLRKARTAGYGIWLKWVLR